MTHTKTTIMKNLTKLDLTGYSKSEISNLCQKEGYSKSTYYNSISRGFIFVEKIAK